MPFKNLLKTIVCLLVAVTLSAILNACAPAKWTRNDFTKLEQAARQGDAKAQLLIGEIYEFGVDVPADDMIAAKWYERAAGQNEPEGLLYLGMMHERGVLREYDSDLILNRLFGSAELGCDTAQIALALHFFKDRGSRREIVRRVEKYRESARRGDPAAQYVLGWVFREGVGLQINPREAMDWYHNSARQGYTAAQVTLGRIYLEGKVAPLDYGQAEKWYEKSAEAEFTARLQLHKLRETGTGRQTKSRSDELLRHADASLRSYIRLQHMLMETRKETNDSFALRACRSLRELDPDYDKISAICEPLYKNSAEKTVSRVEAAIQALRATDWNRFGVIASGLLVSDFDPDETRRLIAFAWKTLDKETTAARRNIESQLQNMEAADRSEAYRMSHARLIPGWVDQFNASINRAQRENPGDATLAALAVRGGQVTSNLQQKMRQQKEEQLTKPAVVPKKSAPEMPPGEEEYKKAHESFARGRFEEAARIFEKTTRIRGFRHIAQSYIYMGICNLALINPAHVNRARELRLKGIVYFQNALRFDRRASLPEGYEKYQSVFTEAKEKMK